MFKDTPDGQTHSYDDGCNPPHEKPTEEQKRCQYADDKGYVYYNCNYGNGDVCLKCGRVIGDSQEQIGCVHYPTIKIGTFTCLECRKATLPQEQTEFEARVQDNEMTLAMKPHLDKHAKKIFQEQTVGWDKTVFRKFYDDNEAGGSSRWRVAPSTVEVFISGLLTSQRKQLLDTIERELGEEKTQAPSDDSHTERTHAKGYNTLHAHIKGVIEEMRNE